MGKSNQQQTGQIDNTGEPIDTILTTEGTEENRTSGRSDNGHGRNENTESTVKPQKRKRGRPAGSTNKNKQETTFILQEETLKQKNSAGTEDSFNNQKFKKAKLPKKKLLSAEEAQATSDFILGITNDFAIQLLGEEAAINPLEGSLLQMSLPNYLQSIEVDTIEKTKSIMYPLMLLGGVSLYGLRLGSMAIEKSKLEREKKKKEEKLQSEGYNFRDNDYETEYQETNNDYPEQSKREGEIDWTQKAYNPFKHVVGF